MTSVRCAAVAAGLLVLVGCSSRPGGAGGPEGAAQTVLSEVNDLLHTGDHPPSKLSDLDKRRSLFPKGYDAIKSGEVVVLWGAPMQGEGQVGKNEAVAAYEKNVPTEGGFVLLSAGTVKRMTAEEFAAAPKAGKK